MQKADILISDRNRVIQNSILLCLYMLFCFCFHFVSREIKPVITILIILTSLISLFYSRLDRLKIHYNFNIATLWLGFIVLCFIIQVINSTIEPVFLYLFAAPAFAYFILENKFDSKIIYLPILVISIFFVAFISSGQDLNKVFPHTSRNYISVLMITNTALINLVEIRQFRKITIWPSILTLIFSLFATGRAGIICSTLLFIGTIFCRFDKLSSNRKILYFFIILIPSGILIILFLDSIKIVFERMDFFTRFEKFGVIDDTRKLLLQSYIDNIDFKSLLLGYNYDTNPLFVKYVLNPHNSYIRLHHYVGILFFPIILYLLYTLFKLFSQNKLYFIILIALLIRGWTDSIFFLSEYDFFIVLFILIIYKSVNRDK